MKCTEEKTNKAASFVIQNLNMAVFLDVFHDKGKGMMYVHLALIQRNGKLRPVCPSVCAFMVWVRFPFDSPSVIEYIIQNQHNQ